MVIVYSYRLWNEAAKRWDYPADKRTRESVAAVGGTIIENSAQEVSETAIDREGRYRPRRDDEI